MTYGWAILIIAVVLGVLFQMGVFNSSSMTVRVPPGAYKVLRTSAAVNLVGQCSGILPQYVAQFNGQNSYIKAGTSTILQSNIFTVTTWVKAPAGLVTQPLVSFSSGFSLPAIWLPAGSGEALVELGGSNYNYFTQNPVTLFDGNWHFVAFVVTGNSQNDIANSLMYADGQLQQDDYSAKSGLPTSKTGFGIGRYGGSSYFDGLISNVQIYNTSLDASSIATLYQEGIGGAPVNPQYLVGWWPLNGDANDYSGNNNNGAPTAITYVSQYGK
jgi:hypothetical protein